jgi:hypothetical protein
VIHAVAVSRNGTKQSEHLIQRPLSRTIGDLTAIYTAAWKLCEFGKRRLFKEGLDVCLFRQVTLSQTFNMKAVMCIKGKNLKQKKKLYVVPSKGRLGNGICNCAAGVANDPGNTAFHLYGKVMSTNCLD